MTSEIGSLIAKLDHTCQEALESSAVQCMSMSHYEVDVEHMLLKLVDGQDTDAGRVFRHFGVDTSRLQRDLTKALETFRTGNTRGAVFSPRLIDWLQDGWMAASVEFGETRVRSGHLVYTLLTRPERLRLIRETTKELAAIGPEDLKARLPQLAAGSVEDEGVERFGDTGAVEPPAIGTGKLGKTPALDQYTVDLTERARAGKLDPVLGRDAEIRQMIDILCRRRQNNPILTGEAGVGKTAVVEGLALRVAAGDVPPAMQGVALRTLDLGLLQAGASVKGEFEKRLRSVMDEVKASPHPIIVFIDEAHTLIGAGGAAGTSDAANLLKPALARGELRTIAATTWSEYKKYFEKDAALARRFQVVKIEEPTEAQAIVMLRGVTPQMEAHHGVRILDDAVASAVRLSHRYLSGRQLPDKAVSVLDTASARVAVSQSAIPAPVEDTRRRIDAVAAELAVLTREAATGLDHAERLQILTAEKTGLEAELARIEQRWSAETELVGRIQEVRRALETPAPAEGAGSGQDPAILRQQLAQLNAELDALQGVSPLVPVCVDGRVVSEVISAWTGIPVRKMVKDEVATVLSLKDMLEERVIGQSHALEAVAQRIQTARAGLEDPGKPIGVFLLVGPSGVGKTETALALADVLYGGERNMVTINMSEYQEAHTVSGLKGSPPGYVGYGEGGVLTEAVRRKPYCVVLLDEVEKAHPDVLELFFQVFDKGVLEDAEGREIDFKNTVILLTSNVGTERIMRLCLGKTPPAAEELTEALRPDLQAVFKPAFIGRTVVIPYYPLQDEALRRVVTLKLAKVRRRFAENHRAELTWDEAVVDAFVARCTDVDSGARNIDYILTGSLLPEMSRTVLARLAAGDAVKGVTVSAGAGNVFTYQVT
jgi:type VI secretion system protein VasG